MAALLLNFLKSRFFSLDLDVILFINLPEQDNFGDVLRASPLPV